MARTIPSCPALSSSAMWLLDWIVSLNTAVVKLASGLRCKWVCVCVCVCVWLRWYCWLIDAGLNFNQTVDAFGLGHFGECQAIVGCGTGLQDPMLDLCRPLWCMHETCWPPESVKHPAKVRLVSCICTLCVPWVGKLSPQVYTDYLLLCTSSGAVLENLELVLQFTELRFA